MSFASQIKHGRLGVNSLEGVISIDLGVRIYLAQVSDQRWPLLNTVKGLRVPEHTRKLRDLVSGCDLHEPGTAS